MGQGACLGGQARCIRGMRQGWGILEAEGKARLGWRAWVPGSWVAAVVVQLLCQVQHGAAAAAGRTHCMPRVNVWLCSAVEHPRHLGWVLTVGAQQSAPAAAHPSMCSVLEPGRSLTLAERSGAGAEVVVAHPAFRLVATMNPGGDYGKKELSPALANRFTSIWVPAIEDLGELRAILESRLAGGCGVQWVEQGCGRGKFGGVAERRAGWRGCHLVCSMLPCLREGGAMGNHHS